MASKDDFRVALKAMLREAELRGARTTDVNARGLHRKVADYPTPDHRMPSCCDAMYEEQRPGDFVLSAPPTGHGTSLTVRYRLPR
jgi:hypothetical protein